MLDSLQTLEYSALALGLGVAVGNKIIVDFLAEQVLRVINPQLFRARQWLKQRYSWAQIEQGLTDGLGLRRSLGVALPEQLSPKNFEKALALADRQFSQLAHEELS